MLGPYDSLGTDCPSTTDEMANDYLCPEKHIQIKLTITQKGLYKFQLTLGALSESVRSLKENVRSCDVCNLA